MTFKPGDSVRLKSGSSILNVEGETFLTGEIIVMHWHNNEVRKFSVYPETLVLADGDFKMPDLPNLGVV